MSLVVFGGLRFGRTGSCTGVEDSCHLIPVRGEDSVWVFPFKTGPPFTTNGELSVAP